MKITLGESLLFDNIAKWIKRKTKKYGNFNQKVFNICINLKMHKIN